MLEDIDIIKNIAKGDKVAFQKLYNCFCAKVYNTALSYVLQVEDAEEITQDVFIKIFQNSATFKGDASVSTWIYRITVNTALNHLEKKKRLSFLIFTKVKREPISFEHPSFLLENKEEAKLLFEVIQTLPDAQKTAFILSFIEDLPRQEVADIMELSLKAVESLLQRGKGNLRKKLEKKYPNRRK